ncbi:MAG: hypothetical protein RIQ89_2311 [Bacteroidota bacterium]
MAAIIYINQSPNDMLIDIIRSRSILGYDSQLWCGKVEPTLMCELEKVAQVTYLKSYNRSTIAKRFFSWLVFSIQVIGKWLLVSKRDIKFVLAVSNPPLYIYFILLLRGKVKVDYLIYDLYPDVIASRNWGSKMLKWLWHGVNKYTLCICNNIFVPSQSIAEKLNRFKNLQAQVVFNWVQLDNIGPISFAHNTFRSEFAKPEEILLLYSGNFGATHNFDVLEDWIIFNKKAQQKFKFLFIGGGFHADRLMKLTHQQVPLAVLPWQPISNFPLSIASGNFAIISYFPQTEESSIPSKVAYYLKTGTPLLYFGTRKSELGSMIEKYNLGFVIEDRHFEKLNLLLLQQTELAYTIQRENCVAIAAKLFSRNNVKLFNSNVPVIH